MKTILKWPGGKEKELPIIRKYTPAYKGRFIEPFVGGGAAFFDTETEACCINDKSKELINLYNCVKNRDSDFVHHVQLEHNEFSSLETLIDQHSTDILQLYHGNLSIDDFLSKYNTQLTGIATDYSAIFLKELFKNLHSKIKRSQKLESAKGSIPDGDRLDNIEAALKSAYYMYIRYLQNHNNGLSKGRQAAVFLFIREYCYSSMFRYNNRGEFNVPYGGISYNRKDFQKKIDYLLSDNVRKKLETADIYCDDFETFIMGLNPTPDDFIFLDPPYDSAFSTYAQNFFSLEDQSRLCNCLKNTKAKIMLIIKNTDYIYNLYKDDFSIKSFDKKYLVSFMNRNDRQAEHLIITNY